MSIRAVFPKVPSVNFHLWQPCNMRCGFCFATFSDVKQEMNLPQGHLPKEDCLLLVDELSDSGFEKINFVGGEPTLCPWLRVLIARAKTGGMVTSIVSNGGFDANWLETLNGHLNWIGLSIDTVDPEKQKRLGRAIRGLNPISADAYLQAIEAIKHHGIRLKVNTVVTRETWREDLTPFITVARPERWKLLQVLPMKGQNDERISDFSITTAQFKAYVRRARRVERDGICVVPESNEALTESYMMIDPAGRFFDNAQGFYRYSDPILKVGVAAALNQVSILPERFCQRGGKYRW